MTEKINKKIIVLEAIRGFLALLVVCGHLVSKLESIRMKQNHTINFFTVWGRECVFMFFILSGVVIHYSYIKQKRSPVLFLKQRFLRLHPTIFLAILLSALVEIFVLDHQLTANIITGNLVPYSTMNAYLAPLLWDTNPPIWSLTFELFFYIIFALLIIRKKEINNTALLIWLLSGFVSIYYYYHPFGSPILNHFVLMLAFSPIWIIGFYIFKYKDKLNSNFRLAIMALSLLPIVSRLHITDNYYDPIKFVFFSLTTYPFFVFILSGNTKKPENWSTITVTIYLLVTFFTSVWIISKDETYSTFVKTLYILLPVLTSFTLRIKIIKEKLTIFLKRWFVPTFAFFGKYSYSIYLVHFPIIILFEHTMLPLPLKIICIGLSTALTCYVIDHQIHPRIKSLIN